MSILRLTSAAVLAAASLGLAGTAGAAPANLAVDQPAAQRTDDGAVTPVWHRGYYHYYYGPYYGYYPRYYYYPYYGYPYYYYPYYYGPSFNLGIRVR
jgi:hypothetical protein